VGKRQGSSSGLIALITDFGDEDWYVGTMKGVIKRIAPEAEIVDICHRVAAQSVLAAAFVLYNSYEFFPTGTVFCVVVDPGVGTQRDALVASDGTYLFVAPNNGVLTLVAEGARNFEVRRIIRRKFLLSTVSATFHGRDVFAPVAAHLVRGKEIAAFGPPITRFVRLRGLWPRPGKRDALEGNVLYIDTFGNLITNIRREALVQLGHKRSIAIDIAGKTVDGIRKTYGSVRRGQIVAYWGSGGWLEIGVNHGSAADVLCAQVGSAVEVRIT
jgi:S-adenosylmethionine hydrolase